MPSQHLCCIAAVTLDSHRLCAIACRGHHSRDYRDFANGLDSGTNLCGGSPCPDCWHFAGQNPNLGVNQMLFPAGRSLYNAFQTSLRANVHNPFTGVKALNWIVSYALSRTDGSALDLDFVNTAIDNNHPTAFFGPNGLDRTHQFSFGGTMDVPGRIPLRHCGTCLQPVAADAAPARRRHGGIFLTDITGDGSGDGSGVYPDGDPLPGTTLGSFGRKVKTNDLNGFLSNYNSNVAGGLTPAGQTLVSNGLFTVQQLQALGADLPQVALAPQGQQGLGWLKTFDLKLSYPGNSVRTLRLSRVFPCSTPSTMPTLTCRAPPLARHSTWRAVRAISLILHIQTATVL